jgi:hypothetical protein
VERFSVPIDRATLHPANAHQSKKSLFSEPILRPLRSENIEERFGFVASRGRAQRDVEVRPAEISVPLWNLVLENELVAESIPSQVGHDAVILMAVVSRMREDNVRSELPSQTFERILDRIEIRRKVTVSKLMEANRADSSSAEHLACSAFGLACSGAGPAPHHPPKLWPRSFARQLRQRSAAPNFNVIGVRA